MPQHRRLLIALSLPVAFSAPAFATEPADPLAAAIEASLCRASSATAGDGPIVQAQYITREQQQERARENLENRRRERDNPPPAVDRSSNTPTGETYGREFQERAIQGTDRPRVTRPW